MPTSSRIYVARIYIELNSFEVRLFKCLDCVGSGRALNSGSRKATSLVCVFRKLMKELYKINYEILISFTLWNPSRNDLQIGTLALLLNLTKTKQDKYMIREEVPHFRIIGI